MISYEKILYNLNVAFKDSGITQDELSCRLGVDPALTSRWLRGVHKMQVVTLLRICEEIGVNPKKLF